MKHNFFFWKDNHSNLWKLYRNKVIEIKIITKYEKINEKKNKTV